MKTSLSIIFTFLLITTNNVMAQNTATHAAISFEEKSFDYGILKKGADGHHTFNFTNTGNAPLIIKSVKSSCGCTVPKKPDDPIAPGAKGSIQVLYDTQRLGVFRKTISVVSNAKTQSAIALKIRGTVVE